MIPREPFIREEFDSLAKFNTSQDDPKLVDFIRMYVLEERRPFVPKVSHRLIQTPQAKEVVQIFKNKVSSRTLRIQYTGRYEYTYITDTK